MAERVALKPLDPNARMSKSAIGTASSKIPRAANAGKSAENDGNEKQALEAKLHEVLDEYDEVRTQYGELEEHSRQLKVAYINMEEEAAEWKKSYESLQAEGTELFQTYERKCAMLKEVSRQLEDHKQKLVERDARLKELQRSKESAEQERDEQREKTKAHNDIISKHESRYLSLKEEHNQTLVKLDALQQQLREAMRSAPRADSAPQQEVVGTLDTLQIKKMEKMLEEADTREKKAREELQSVKQQMHRLLQGDNTACTSPDNVSALQATSATPARGFLPKTPSGAMLEMANLSPESLYERAESLLISNDLLRQALTREFAWQELNASKREREQHEETLVNLEAAVRDLKAEADDSKRKLRLATENQVAAEDERDAAQGEARELASRVTELEEAGHAAGEAVVEELQSAKAQLAVAESRHLKAQSELVAAKKQMAAQAEAAKNAENDMRLMYKRHKKELGELEDKHKSGELEARYGHATQKALQMEALVHKWVGYAREMGEVRALQQRRAAAIESNSAAVQALVQDALEMKEAADARVGKWRKQCRRMEKDMTKLVRIKTRALEERNQLHEKYLELYQELEAQDEYAQKLEANEERLKTAISARAAEEVEAVRDEAEERVRVEMEEKVREARAEMEEKVREMEEKVREARQAEEKVRVEMEEKVREGEVAQERLRVEMREELKVAQGGRHDLIEHTSALRSKVVELEAALSSKVAELEVAAAKLQEGASETATVAKGQLEAMEARARVQEDVIGRLTGEVAEMQAELRQATEQHDQIFEGTMLEMEAKQEKCAELEALVSKVSGEADNLKASYEALVRKLSAELEDAANKVEEAERLREKVEEAERVGESEREATQEALDELTKDLSAAHEELAVAEAKAEEAEGRAEAATQAAACAVARLTRVTVGMAADEDNNTDMIDPELRLHWCDDEYERKLRETKTPHELRALLVGIASTVEYLLTSAAARRDKMQEQVAEMEHKAEQLESRVEKASVKVVQSRNETATVRKELEQTEKDLLEAVERGEALQLRLAEEQTCAHALRERVELVEEEMARLKALLEDSSRETAELSVHKEEVMRMRPERDALQSSLDACMSKLSQASVAEDVFKKKAEKKIETLKHNLQVSQNDCQALDAILAHVRASLQMYVETPSAMPPDTLKKLLHRISPEDRLDDEAEE